MKRLLGEQPERRPMSGPASSWAKKNRVGGKNKDLQRSSAPAEVSQIHATRVQIPWAAVWAICTLAATSQNRKVVGRSRHPARSGEFKTPPIVTECRLNITETLVCDDDKPVRPPKRPAGK